MHIVRLQKDFSEFAYGMKSGMMIDNDPYTLGEYLCKEELDWCHERNVFPICTMRPKPGTPFVVCILKFVEINEALMFKMVWG